MFVGASSWIIGILILLEYGRFYLTSSSSPSQITNSGDSEAVTYRKLVKGHAYSVTGADQVSKFVLVL